MPDNNLPQKVYDLERKIEDMRRYIDERIRMHDHNGNDAQRVNADDLLGEVSGGTSALNPQTPSGTIDGSNTSFTISGTISLVTQNGKVLDPSAEWTVSGTTLSLTIAPDTGDSLYAY